ncbi:MAG TPA: hypothetical protein VMF13_19815, partial [Luteitalea sp.]|nr:hypothetical protein [Luteitalea sp.]
AGRNSPPLQTWPVALTPPGSWGRAFTLPVDVGFVGFKASEAVAAAAPQVRLTPQRIVDVSQRPRTPAVLGSATYGHVVVLVHGEDAWPERDGIWMRGRTTATLTVIAPPGRRALLLRAGAVQVDVVVSLDGRDTAVTLNPGEQRTVDLAWPTDAGTTSSARQVRIRTSAGFVPAEIEAGSRDRRLLGVWLAFAPVP